MQMHYYCRWIYSTHKNVAKAEYDWNFTKPSTEVDGNNFQKIT